MPQLGQRYAVVVSAVAALVAPAAPAFAAPLQPVPGPTPVIVTPSPSPSAPFEVRKIVLSHERVVVDGLAVVPVTVRVYARFDEGTRTDADGLTARFRWSGGGDFAGPAPVAYLSHRVSGAPVGGVWEGRIYVSAASRGSLQLVEIDDTAEVGGEAGARTVTVEGPTVTVEAHSVPRVVFPPAAALSEGDAAYRIVGRLTDDAGRPYPAETAIHLTVPGRLALAARTDATGLFGFRVADRVPQRGAQRWIKMQTHDVTVASAVLDDVTGEPVPGVRVRMRPKVAVSLQAALAPRTVVGRAPVRLTGRAPDAAGCTFVVVRRAPDGEWIRVGEHDLRPDGSFEVSVYPFPKRVNQFRVALSGCLGGRSATSAPMSVESR